MFSRRFRSSLAAALGAFVLSTGLVASTTPAPAVAALPDDVVDTRTVLAGGGSGWGTTPSAVRLPEHVVVDTAPTGRTWVYDGALGYLDGSAARRVPAQLAGTVADLAARPDGTALVLTTSALLRVTSSATVATVATLPAGETGRALSVRPDGTAVVGTSTRVLAQSGTGFVPLPGTQPWTSVTDVAAGPSGEVYVAGRNETGSRVWKVSSGAADPQLVAGSSATGMTQEPAAPGSATSAMLFPVAGAQLSVVGTGPAAGELWISTYAFVTGGRYAAAVRLTGSDVRVALTTPAPCRGSLVTAAGPAARVRCVQLAGQVDGGLSTLYGVTGTAAPYTLGSALTQHDVAADAPDGVAASDSYLSGVRDAVRTADGRTWVVSSGGLRWFDGAGALRTARLPGLPSAADMHSLAAAGNDVLVAAGDRVVRVAAAASGPTAATPLGSGWSDARDVAVFGQDVLVADAGRKAVVRIPPSGAQADVLTGSGFVTVAAGPRGVVAGGPEGLIELGAAGRRTLSSRAVVDADAWGDRWLVTDGVVHDLRVDGSIGVLQGAFLGAKRAHGSGSGLVVVETARVLSVPDPQPSTVPAPPTGVVSTPRAGYIDVTWPGQPNDDLELRRSGGPARTTAWDRLGGACGGPIRSNGSTYTSLSIWCDREAPDGLVASGVDYTGHVVRHAYVAVGGSSAETWSAPATVSASTLPDDGPPAAPVVTSVTANRNVISVAWTSDSPPDRREVDVVRYQAGSTPPASPTDGLAATVSANRVSLSGDIAPDTDYSFAIFTLDHRGNVSAPAVAGPVRLDTTPPAALTGVSVAPDYRTAVVTWSPSDAADLKGTVVAVTRASEPAPVLSCAQALEAPGSSSTTLYFLTHGTDYTVRVRACDTSGNAGDVTSVTFTTLRDVLPPGAPTVTATASGQTVTTISTPPADEDFASVAVRLAVSPAVPATPDEGIKPSMVLGKPLEWRFDRLRGATTYTVVSFAIDRNGLWTTSAPIEVTTAPDTTPPVLAATVFWAGDSAGRISVRVSPRAPIGDFAGVKLAVTEGTTPAATPSSGRVLPDLPCVTVTTCTALADVPAYDRTYTVTAWPYDVSGNLGAPLSRTFTVADPRIPGTPAGLTVSSLRDGAIRVGWTGANNGSGPEGAVSGWEVQVSQPDGSVRTRVTGTASARSLDVVDLIGGRPVEVRLYALAAGGARSSAAATSFTPADTTRPLGVGPISAQGLTGAATLSWANSPSYDVRQYVVRWAKGRIAPASATAGSGLTLTGTSTKLTGLVAGADTAVAVFPVDWAGLVGPASTIVVEGTRQSIATSVASPTYGASVRLSGKVTRASGAAVAGATVTLQRRAAGSTGGWTHLAVVNATKSGTWAYTWKPTARSDVRALFAGVAMTASEARVTQDVRLKVVATASRKGTTVTVAGSVAPAGTRTVRLQRYYSKAWRTVATASTRTNGAYRLAAKAPRGTWSFRVVATGSSVVSTGTSATLRVKIP